MLNICQNCKEAAFSHKLATMLAAEVRVDEETPTFFVWNTNFVDFNDFFLSGIGKFVKKIRTTSLVTTSKPTLKLPHTPPSLACTKIYCPFRRISTKVYQFYSSHIAFYVVLHIQLSTFSLVRGVRLWPHARTTNTHLKAIRWNPSCV